MGRKTAVVGNGSVEIHLASAAKRALRDEPSIAHPPERKSDRVGDVVALLICVGVLFWLVFSANFWG